MPLRTRIANDSRLSFGIPKCRLRIAMLAEIDGRVAGADDVENCRVLEIVVGPDIGAGSGVCLARAGDATL